MIYSIFKFYEEHKELFSVIKDVIEFVGFCTFVLKLFYNCSLSKENKRAVLTYNDKNKQNFIEFVKTKSYLKANLKDRCVFVALYTIVGLSNIYLIMNYFENPKVYIDCSLVIFSIMSFVKAKDDEYCYVKSIKI